MRRKVCFFTRIADRTALERADFYAQDVQILRDLGYEVVIANSIWQLPVADVYFVWWWTWAFVPVALAKLLRRRVVITGVLDIWHFRNRPWWHRRLMAFALRRADANVFVSQMEFSDAQALFCVCGGTYVPITVNTELYSPSGAPKRDVVATMVWLHGGNAIRKSVPELIRAATIVHRKYPSIKFIIAGQHASYYKEALKLVQELGASSYIEFPGIISIEEKINLMQNCAVYAQPTRFEGFGLAILEAMSCGAAVVTSPVGAVPEVGGQAVKYTDGTNPAAIADAICELLESPETRAALGRLARERAEKQFGRQVRRQAIGEILESLFAKAE